VAAGICAGEWCAGCGGVGAPDLGEDEMRVLIIWISGIAALSLVGSLLGFAFAGNSKGEWVEQLQDFALLFAYACGWATHVKIRTQHHLSSVIPANAGIQTFRRLAD
jgi:hypothetical protein